MSRHEIESERERKRWHRTRYPGVYYRLAKSGERLYWIAYRDSDGDQQWERTYGSLQDAVATLADINARKQKGDRIRSTSLTTTDLWELWWPTKSRSLATRTGSDYESHWRVHLQPRFGSKRVRSLSPDEIANLITDMTSTGYSGKTVANVLGVLSVMLNHAARRGYVSQNPVALLERAERPSQERAPKRILSSSEIEALLECVPTTYLPILQTTVFTGLRQSEVLGLVWDDHDLDRDLIRVRLQIDRRGNRVRLKTPGAQREVRIIPALRRVLVQHRLQSPYSQGGDFIFANLRGRAFSQRNVSQRGLGKAVEDAGLHQPGLPDPTFHDLRHTFASMLIAEGANVVYVSRQLGHANAAITLKIYAHQFASQDQADRMALRLEERYGAIL